VAKQLLTGWEGCIVEADKGCVLELSELRLLPFVIPALLRFSAAGYEVTPTTNRRGLSQAQLAAAAAVDVYAVALLQSQGVSISAVRVCSHAQTSECTCRKPGVGLIADLLQTLDRGMSHVVDVDETAREFARNIGIAFEPLNIDSAADGWRGVAHRLLDAPRQALVHRKTRETDIRIRIDLDDAAEPRASTGLAFFDHMLEQLGKHGGFLLDVHCDGDLEIDEHHTIEDVALAIGAALREALGDKRGIERYGFVLPMDETRAEVSIDLGGRPYLVFTAEFPREEVGGMPTELVEHFFRSLSDSLGASLHVSVSGENTHHMIEACFKGLARALRMATQRSGNALPSTKGVL
jgi:imidazoleglycerol-phosphate dehydratase/histidinol-phosphatase